MTKKDYILIAQAIQEEYLRHTENDDEDAIVTIVFLVDKLCSRLSLDNPDFDRQKFRNYALPCEE